MSFPLITPSGKVFLFLSYYLGHQTSLVQGVQQDCKVDLAQIMHLLASTHGYSFAHDS